MAIITTQSNYWMSPSALTFTLNALDDPDYNQVTVLGGAVIMAFVQGIIDYDASRNYRKWTLEAFNSYFETTDAKYVYARLEKSGTKALIIYPDEEVDLDFGNYYYIYLGKISASVNSEGTKVNRYWEDIFKTGILNTNQFANEETGAEWKQMFRWNKVTDLIEVLKTFSSFVVNKFFLRDKEVSDIKRSTDKDEDVPITDKTLTTAKYVSDGIKALEEKYIRKDQPDLTKFLTKFLGGLHVGEVIDSMIAGKGVLADANGRIQADRAEIRGALVVLDLIINEIHAMAGDFSFSDSGAIERVENLGSNTYRLWMRKDTEFDFTTLEVNDVMFSIINTIKMGGNDYYTSWFRCLAKNITDNTLTVLLYPNSEVPGGVNYPPIAGYNVTRRGSSYTPVDGTHNERQDSWLISSREGRIMFMQNVFKPILEDYNYALTIGRFPNIQAIKNLPISESDLGIYAKIGVFERIYQADYNGDIIANEVMRGDWSAHVAASQSPYRRIVNIVDTPNGSKTNNLEIHAVYHLGCKWHCLVDKTLDEPGWNVPGWQFVEGDEEYAMDFLSSNGYQFISGNVNTVVTARFYYGRIDITDKVMALPGTDVQWTRNTENIPEDNSWKPTYDGAKNKLILTREDMGTNWMAVRKAMFICKVFIPVGEEYKIVTESFPFNI